MKFGFGNFTRSEHTCPSLQPARHATMTSKWKFSCREEINSCFTASLLSFIGTIKTLVNRKEWGKRQNTHKRKEKGKVRYTLSLKVKTSENVSKG